MKKLLQSSASTSKEGRVNSYAENIVLRKRQVKPTMSNTCDSLDLVVTNYFESISNIIIDFFFPKLVR